VWAIVADELQRLEEWVRTIAVPILLTGRHDVPALPPHLDTSVGYSNLRAALTEAGAEDAVTRAKFRITAVVARDGLADILAMALKNVGPETIRAWVSSLEDRAVLHHTDHMARVKADMRALSVWVRDLEREVHMYATHS
jgi:hypothetical protein